MESCSGRPNRSDVHLSAEEEAKLEKETRDYFQENAPMRHTKPQRSEYSAQYTDALSSNGSIPEFIQFQHLEENHLQKLNHNEKGQLEEEFIETEYYKDLNGVGKQHHTTGTGFIQTENANGKCFSLEPDSFTGCHASGKGNPATNDWIPAAADGAAFASDKPKRSDN